MNQSKENARNFSSAFIHIGVACSHNDKKGSLYVKKKVKVLIQDQNILWNHRFASLEEKKRK